MNKRHKYGHFYYGKIHRFNKIVLIKILPIHGNYIKNGVKWKLILEIAG
jgi:hypothetical protein